MSRLDDLIAQYCPVRMQLNRKNARIGTENVRIETENARIEGKADRQSNVPAIAKQLVSQLHSMFSERMA